MVHLFASRHEGLWFNPRGGTYMEPGFSCKLASLHWWPQRDWSLWHHLRRALSWTVTRPTMWCDNPTWSHTALLTQFHSRCRSFVQLHNQCQLLGGGGVLMWKRDSSVSVVLLQFILYFLGCLLFLGTSFCMPPSTTFHSPLWILFLLGLSSFCKR